MEESKNFWVDTMALQCGNVLLGEGRTHPSRIVITNTSTRRRTYNIIGGLSSVPYDCAIPELVFWLEHEGSAQDNAKNEEEIEVWELNKTLTRMQTLR